MKNQFTNEHGTNTDGVQHKPEIALPIVALGLDFVPVLMFFLANLDVGFGGFWILSILLCPITGLIMGVMALCRGKQRIGIAGKVIAIIAIGLTVAFAVIIVVFLVGAVTGVIPFM